MSNPPHSQAATTQQLPPYPSYEERKDAQLKAYQQLSLYQFQMVPGPEPEVTHVHQLPGLRLIWELSGPLTTSVSIKQGNNAPEPYWNSDRNQWHHLAISSLTEPRVSSITVTVDVLDRWYYNWFEGHRNHSNPPSGDAPVVIAGGRGAVWQVRAGWNPEVNDDDGDWNKYDLTECCGQMAPRNKGVSLKVLPAEDGEGFATLHDYLSTVHPWLMSLRGDIIGALTTTFDNPIAPGALFKISPVSSIQCLAVEHPFLWDVSPGDTVPMTGQWGGPLRAR